ncbi:MAG TPA: molybdopterin dinucleotide binding domain-containing protein, partial [Candidatus Bathyarchaeia archaeon]|nr:molybdopterin dinucleotide binding domain-containing protein [Candidatus Bathyarchaeia archaeon]
YFTKSPEECIELLIQNLDGVSLQRLRREGAIQIEVGGRPYVPFLEKKFPTPSGRVEFYVERSVQFGQELPIFIEPEEGTPKNPLAKKYPLVFLQSHSRFHTHTSHANNQWLLEVNPEPVLEINPVDAQARGVQDGDSVMVFNSRGEVKVKAELNEAIRPGIVDIHWGWWPRQFAKGHPQCLTNEKINPALVSPNFSFFDCLVEVKRA